jgi:hypothetical protein
MSSRVIINFWRKTLFHGVSDFGIEFVSTAFLIILDVWMLKARFLMITTSEVFRSFRTRICTASMRAHSYLSLRWYVCVCRWRLLRLAEWGYVSSDGRYGYEVRCGWLQCFEHWAMEE